MARLQDIAWAYRVSCNKGEYRVGHNTRLFRIENGWRLRYHSTDVVESVDFPSIGAKRVTVNTGGWRTSTTAQRVHHALLAVGLRLTTNDRWSGDWRVLDGRGNAFTIRGNKLMLRHDGNEWSRIAE